MAPLEITSQRTSGNVGPLMAQKKSYVKSNFTLTPPVCSGLLLAMSSFLDIQAVLNPPLGEASYAPARLKVRRKPSLS